MLPQHSARAAWVLRARTNIGRALILFSISLHAACQTIRPVRSEYRSKAQGKFEVVNDTFVPVNVTLSPKSFSVSETGEISYRPLDSSIQLRLSAMSLRIAPKQSSFVLYEAKADSLPAWFVIYAILSGLPVRTASGMDVRIELPHTVYILPKKNADKQEIRILLAKYDASRKQLLLEVENTGPLFARVLATELALKRKNEDGPGFPLFPKSRRRIEIPWRGQGTPERLVLHFVSFKIEVPIE